MGLCNKSYLAKDNIKKKKVSWLLLSGKILLTLFCLAPESPQTLNEEKESIAVSDIQSLCCSPFTRSLFYALPSLVMVYLNCTDTKPFAERRENGNTSAVHGDPERNTVMENKGRVWLGVKTSMSRLQTVQPLRASQAH